jgi:transmembrane sensor
MSNNNTHMNDDLLVKYLVGEATPDESAQVQKWINANKENSQYYNQFKTIWDKSLEVAGMRNIDEDAAYERLQNRIKNTVPIEQAKVKPMRTPNWVSIAASLIIICTVGYLTFNYFTNRVIIVSLQSQNSVVTQTLPDGSVVTLNALSKLAYPKNFKGDSRQVRLAGEAFFKVSPDKTKPFIIKVNDVTVRVVGTSFNIKSRNGKTEVVVETGIVNVSRAQNNINLIPGEKTEIISGSTDFTKQSVYGKLYDYYITKQLVCNQTPLNELVEALNGIYGQHIVIANPQLKRMAITTIFKDQSLDQILDVVAETFKISVEHKNGQIILK